MVSMKKSFINTDTLAPISLFSTSSLELYICTVKLVLNHMSSISYMKAYGDPPPRKYRKHNTKTSFFSRKYVSFLDSLKSYCTNRIILNFLANAIWLLSQHSCERKREIM